MHSGKQRVNRKYWKVNNIPKNILYSLKCWWKVKLIQRSFHVYSQFISLDTQLSTYCKISPFKFICFKIQAYWENWLRLFKTPHDLYSHRLAFCPDSPLALPLLFPLFTFSLFTFFSLHRLHSLHRHLWNPLCLPNESSHALPEGLASTVLCHLYQKHLWSLCSESILCYPSLIFSLF